MSPSATPYLQITDPDDLALSEEDDRSQSPAEATRSLSTLGDDDLGIYEHEKNQQAGSSNHGRLEIIGWMIANTIATIGSVRSGSLSSSRACLDHALTTLQVFTNKLLFNSSTFRYDQLSFAAYHFAVTGILLCILSSSPFNYFDARRVKALEMLPLSISLCMSVVVSNLSLAYSSALYYQIVPALVAPCVAAINCFFYKAVMPRMALMALMPMFMGIAMITYSNPGSSRDDSSLPTTPKGAIFAFAAAVMTALHTVWMDVFQRRYQLDATQLLFNQAPLSSIVLLYVIPWADTFPVWNELPKNTLGLLLLVRLAQLTSIRSRFANNAQSGACTCFLDVSHMHIIAEVGPVSSTILENVKAILIVAIGACAGGIPATKASAPGIVLAIMGVVG